MKIESDQMNNSIIKMHYFFIFLFPKLVRSAKLPTIVSKITIANIKKFEFTG